MTAYINGVIDIYVWPSQIDDKSYDRLTSCGIHVINRNLDHMKDGCFDQHNLIIEHIKRSTKLANMIVDTINTKVKTACINKNDVIIANEGFAFSAKGDAALDLSGYKYILMYTLIENGYTNFRTYSPITIKKTAGCSKKGLGKDAMIEAFGNENPKNHHIIDVLQTNPDFLKKKTNYVLCMDDIADSYWCYKTCETDKK